MRRPWSVLTDLWNRQVSSECQIAAPFVKSDTSSILSSRNISKLFVFLGVSELSVSLEVYTTTICLSITPILFRRSLV